MAADIQDWISNREMFARRVSSTEVLGLLKRSFTVPASTIAAVVESGKRRVVKGGEQLSGRFDAVLIKTQEMPVYFQVSGLRTKDGYGMSAGIRLTLQLESFEPDRVEDFCRNFTAANATTSAEDMRAYLAEDVKRALSEYISSHEAAELHNAQSSAEVEGGVRRALEGPLFGKGLTFRKLMELEFHSDSFEKARDDSRKANEKIREHEGVLLDQQRREEKLKNLAALMKSADAQEVFREIRDERVKSLLYAKLMESDLKDVSSEDLRAKLNQWGDDLIGVVLKAYAALSETPESGPVESGKTEKLARVIVTAGSRVLLFNPDDFTGSCRLIDAGFNLRSARIHVSGGKSLIFAGGKRQISAIDPETTHAVAAYPLPQEKKPKGGVNASAVWKNRMFATHSELGLIEWDLAKPGVVGSTIYGELTALATTVRAATTTADGWMYFASGRTVYGLDLEKGGPPVAFAPQTPSGVTAIAVGERLIVAGCGSGNEGALAIWDRRDPTHAVGVIRRNAPIGSVRLTSIGGVPHMLFTCRDHGVTARVIGQTLETHYDSGEHSVILAEGGSDHVVAIDHNGRFLIAWDAARPAKPRKILDLNAYTDQAVYDLAPVFGGGGA
ncbi:MAG: hypothetical protein K8T20_18285 [Planctomycetes bacterium]|nr:hypothetical protein [Planctomycetota bacterium]